MGRTLNGRTQTPEVQPLLKAVASFKQRSSNLICLKVQEHRLFFCAEVIRPPIFRLRGPPWLLVDRTPMRYLSFFSN